MKHRNPLHLTSTVGWTDQRIASIAGTVETPLGVLTSVVAWTR